MACCSTAAPAVVNRTSKSFWCMPTKHSMEATPKLQLSSCKRRFPDCPKDLEVPAQPFGAFREWPLACPKFLDLTVVPWIRYSLSWKFPSGHEVQVRHFTRIFHGISGLVRWDGTPPKRSRRRARHLAIVTWSLAKARVRHEDFCNSAGSGWRRYCCVYVHLHIYIYIYTYVYIYVCVFVFLGLGGELCVDVFLSICVCVGFEGRLNWEQCQKETAFCASDLDAEESIHALASPKGSQRELMICYIC